MTLRYGEVATVLKGLPVVIDVACRMTGISQRELARRAGLSSATVSRLVSGHDITVSSAVAILRALDNLASPG